MVKWEGFKRLSAHFTIFLRVENEPRADASLTANIEDGVFEGERL